MSDTEPTLWDIDSGRDARDDAMERVSGPWTAKAWQSFAWVALTTVCARQDLVTSEDVWRELERMNVPRPGESRRWDL